jgi:uncharacterized protein
MTSRSEALASAALLAAVSVFIAVPLASEIELLALAGVGACAALVAKRTGHRGALQIAVFATLLALTWWLPFGFSQVAYGLALVAYAVAVTFSPSLLGGLGWLRRGKLSREALLLIAGAIVTSSTALLAWHTLMRPDVRDIITQFFPSTPVPWPLLALGAVAFSMLNAAVEEGAYRGVLLHSLTDATGNVTLAMVVQATAFGVAHLHGFPRGAVGMGLAGIYGLMIGAIRLRSRGMLAPWLAHVAADMTIVGILVMLAR